MAYNLKVCSLSGPFYFHRAYQSYLHTICVKSPGESLKRLPTGRVGHLKNPPMSTTTHSRTPPTLGHCPDCTAEIASYDVLIEYETEDGQPAIWAECPECREVVHPE